MTKASISGCEAVWTIRAALQEYKRCVPPNVDFYHVKREDLLEWLSLTMIIWESFAENETLIDDLIRKVRK